MPEAAEVGVRSIRRCQAVTSSPDPPASRPTRLHHCPIRPRTPLGVAVAEVGVAVEAAVEAAVAVEAAGCHNPCHRTGQVLVVVRRQLVPNYLPAR